MRLGRITVLAALVVAVAEAAVSTAAPESATIVQGDLGRKLDAYLSRLEALGYSGGLVVVKGGRDRPPEGLREGRPRARRPHGPRRGLQPRLDHQALHRRGRPAPPGAGQAEDERPDRPLLRGRAGGQGGDHARAPPHPLLRARVGLQPHRLRADDARGVRAPRARVEAPLRPRPGLRVRERGLQPARGGRRAGDAGRTTRRPSASWC